MTESLLSQETCFMVVRHAVDNLACAWKCTNMERAGGHRDYTRTDHSTLVRCSSVVYVSVAELYVLVDQLTLVICHITWRRTFQSLIGGSLHELMK